MPSRPFPHVHMKYHFNVVPLTFQNMGIDGKWWGDGYHHHVICCIVDVWPETGDQYEKVRDSWNGWL